MRAYIVFLRIHPKKLLLLFISLILILIFFTFASNSLTLTIRLPNSAERFKLHNKAYFHTSNVCIDSNKRRRPLLLYNLNDVDKPYLFFNCSYYKYIDKFGLDETLDKPQRSRERVIVTAVSNSFRRHVFRFIHSIRRFYRNETIIVYDLGLQCRTWHKLVNLCGVEVRFFNYRLYPDRVKEKGEFRWKPIVIAETLKEFGSVWYMDTSVILTQGGFLEKTEKLSTCSPGVINLYNFGLPSGRTIEEAKYQQNLFHCTKAPVLLSSFTGHGIFAATDPYVYKYFPPQIEYFKTDRARMYESGLLYWNRDQKSKIEVLKWWVLCALETDCMRNHSTVQHCEFSENEPWRTFGKCHRYDQSVLNLLLFNVYGEDSSSYFSELTDFFEIRREVDELQTIELKNISCSY